MKQDLHPEYTEVGAKVIKLIEALEDLDDSQEVFSNAIIPEESYG